MQLAVNNVSFAYEDGTRAITDVSIAIRSGEIGFILGKNGSGKSTLLSCIAGIRVPSSGTITLDGEEVLDLSPRRRAQTIGFVGQTIDPGFSFSALESVLLGRTPHVGPFSTPGPEDTGIAEESLGSVGLLHYANRPVSQMSGGEQQLVRIARGLCQRAPVLLLDEPGAHLDPANRERILEIIAQLATGGTAFLLSSHDPNDALRFGNHVTLLRDGRVLAAGEPRDALEPAEIAAAFGLRSSRSVVAGEEVLVSLRPRFVTPESIQQNTGFLGDLYRSPGGATVLVTGLRGTGKTTWCTELIAAAASVGIAAAGVVAPAVFDGRHKVAIDQTDLRTNTTRRLATRIRAYRGRWAFGNDEPRRAWEFDDEVIAWINGVFDRELSQEAPLVVVDEIGPLELLHGEGVQAALRLIDERRYRLAAVVVRSSLVAQALERWPWAIPIRTE